MVNVQLINLTPHVVTLLVGDEAIEFPSEGCARLGFDSKTKDMIRIQGDSGVAYGFPIEDVNIGEAVGLPAPQEGKMYIVSQLLVNQLPDRRDLVAPKQLVRDKANNVIGCRSFGRPGDRQSVGPQAV